ILGGGDISSDIDNESAELESKYHYNIPITFGVSLERNLNSRIGLNLGLNFTYLGSSVTYTLEEKEAKRTFNHYYLNLPIGVNYKAATFNHCSLYIPGRIGIDIPLKTHISTTNPVNIKLPEINLPKLRVFVSSGVGLNYNLTRDVNLYIEPSIKYYINKTTEPSIWEGRNFEFNIPIGIRYSW
ncbi:MAG: outer membrane beta-barrel protein, partial [Muribaculaceae bacterium]|nr:outer membrane beta-barrel protein [Muribaculaceae bacterium]